MKRDCKYIVKSIELALEFLHTYYIKLTVSEYDYKSIGETIT